MAQRTLFVFLTVGLVVLQVSCGGSSSPPPPPPPPPVTIVISPAGPISVGAGQTRQFSAAISGTTNRAVTWQVNGMTGGDITTVGSIDVTGVYTAPQLVLSPSTVNVKAILQSDTTKTSSAAVNVTVFVAITNPISRELTIGSGCNFTAVVMGIQDTAVDWNLTGAGTIFPNGNSADYTAPPNIPTPPAVVITATSHADPTRSATDTFDIITDPFINQGTQSTPIALGTSGGNVLDHSTQFCCSGTLGALVSRNGTFYILSNNHVLGRSGAAKAGESISQPGLVDNNCLAGKQVATFSQAAPLQNGGVDDALAQIVSGEIDITGPILQLGALSGGSPQPAPPADSTTPTIGMPIAKSGRTTGLTCGSITSTNTTVQVTYSMSCGGATTKTITYTNQVITSGSFGAAGDSGSLIVDSQTAQPVALLFAGDDNSGSAVPNPIQAVLTALKDTQQPPHFPTIVGGAQHPVSGCANSMSAIAPFAGARLSRVEEAAAVDIKQRHESELMQDTAVLGVGVGSTALSGQAAILVYVERNKPHRQIPSLIEGLPSRIIEVGRFMANDWDRHSAARCSQAQPEVSHSRLPPQLP